MNARTKPAEALEVSLADIHEVRKMGARNSAFRSADQTAAALFWHCAPRSLDPSWEPLVQSSRDTGYPNSNCVVGGAVAGLLRSLLGNDGSPVSLSHPELGVTRTFHDLSAMLQEVEDAKVWAGTHLRTTAVESTELGLSLARDLRRAGASLGRSRTR